MLKKWNEFNSINEKKKDPNAPKFGTPEYWEYLKSKKKDGGKEKADTKDCDCDDKKDDKKDKRKTKRKMKKK